MTLQELALHQSADMHGYVLRQRGAQYHIDGTDFDTIEDAERWLNSAVMERRNRWES